MSDKKQGIILLILLMAILAYLTGIGMVNGSEDDHVEIAVIAQSKYGYQWELLAQGAKAAASEYGTDIQIYAPDYEKDVEAQRYLIEMAIENEVDAILIAPIDYVAVENSLKQALDNNILVMNMVLPSTVEAPMPYIGTNHYRSGKEMGQRLIEQIGTRGKIGIIIERTDVLEQRKKGLMDVFSAYPDLQTLTIENTLADEFSAARIAKTMMDYNEDLVAIIGLNSTITQGICLTLDKDSRTLPIYGFGFSDELVKYLDLDLIKSNMIENHFGIGYYAASSAIQQLQGKTTKVYRYIDGLIVDKQNMYNEDIQKVIFELN